MKKVFVFFLTLILLLPAWFIVDAESDDQTADDSISTGAAEISSASDLDFTKELKLFAASTYLVNLDTGRVIYQNNQSARTSPASTTKIMSAALALSLCDDPAATMVTLPEDLWAEFAGIDISHAGLLGGEVLSIEQLVHCMLLQSANEAASGVAAYFGREIFIDMMNQKAQSLGCNNTRFTNPHGLYDANHYTTAEDLFKITRWAISVPGFYEIASKTRYEIPETNKNEEKIIVTSILMQDINSGYYTSYIKGIKTGTLEESGRCLVSTAQKNDMTFCLVLLGCPLENTDVFWSDGRSVFNETRIIYDWLFSNAAIKNIINPDTVITEIKLKYSGMRDSIVLYPCGELSAVIRKNSDVAPVVRYDVEIPESVEAPVSAGQVIGSAKVYADNIFAGEVELISREDVEFSWFVMMMDKVKIILTSKPAIIIYTVIGFVVAFYVYYIMVLVYRAHRRGKKNRRKSGQKKS